MLQGFMKGLGLSPELVVPSAVVLRDYGGWEPGHAWPVQACEAARSVAASAQLAQWCLSSMQESCGTCQSPQAVTTPLNLATTTRCSPPSLHQPT